MNHHIVTMVCLLAWTASTGFCQDQSPKTDASVPNPASASKAAQPAEAVSADLADTLLTQINATKLELDSFRQTLGASHPKVLATKRKLELMQSMCDSDSSAALQPRVKSRTEMQQFRDQLLVSYDEAEQQAQDIASAQKPADKNKALSPDRIASNKQRLTQAVRRAFNLQQQLQDARLQLAEADLRKLQAKHQRRSALADQIVERRVQQLQDADEAMLPTPFSMSSNESINVPAGPLKNNSLTIAFPNNQTHFQVGQKVKLLIQLKELPPREAGRPFSVEVEVPEQFEILGAGTSENPAGLIVATRVVRFDFTKTTVPQTRELPIQLQAKQIGAKCQIRAHLTWQDWKYDRELDVTIDRGEPMRTPLVESLSVVSNANQKTASQAGKAADAVKGSNSGLVQAPFPIYNIPPYTKIRASDIKLLFCDPDDGPFLTKAEVTGKFVNQRLKQHQRITRDMLVDKPIADMVGTYTKEAVAGREVFQHSRYQSLTFPQMFQSLQDFPYGPDLEKFPEQLPDWTGDYITAVVQQLESKANSEWKELEFRLLWSLEPLVFYSSTQLDVDLQPLATLLKNKFPSPHEFKKHPNDYHPLWHSDLVLGMLARLTDDLSSDLINLPIVNKETIKQLELLKTMCANKAESQWIDQEQVRLDGLLQKAPLAALKLLLLEGNWPENSSYAELWLYALSTKSQYQASRSTPPKVCPPPVDPVLMVYAMRSVAGQSDSTDEHLAAFLEEPHPSYAFRRHLSDLLSSDLSYRDATLKALANIYRITENKRLKAAIKNAAPGAPVLAQETTE